MHEDLSGHEAPQWRHNTLRSEGRAVVLNVRLHVDGRAVVVAAVSRCFGCRFYFWRRRKTAGFTFLVQSWQAAGAQQPARSRAGSALELIE